MTVIPYGAVTEHGTWARYVPSPVPADAPANALFSRRDSDGIDWYDFVNAGTNFATDTVKMTVRSDNIVAAAVDDPTRLFPGNAVLVLEVADVPLDTAQDDWGGKVYDPATKTFSDPPPITPPPGPGTAALELRIAALEAKLGGT